MKNSNDTIGNRIRDLLAQPTASPRSPVWQTKWCLRRESVICQIRQAKIAVTQHDIVLRKIKATCFSNTQTLYEMFCNMFGSDCLHSLKYVKLPDFFRVLIASGVFFSGFLSGPKRCSVLYDLISESQLAWGWKNACRTSLNSAVSSVGSYTTCSGPIKVNKWSQMTQR